MMGVAIGIRVESNSEKQTYSEEFGAKIHIAGQKGYIDLT